MLSSAAAVAVGAGAATTGIVSRDLTTKRYDTHAWKRRIKQWKELKAQKLSTYHNKQLSRSVS